MYLLMTDRYEFESHIRVICLCRFIPLTKKLLLNSCVKKKINWCNQNKVRMYDKLLFELTIHCEMHAC